MLETDARDRVIVALDCDRERALELAHELSGHAAWLKVGMTLYYAEGPEIVKTFKDSSTLSSMIFRIRFAAPPVRPRLLVPTCSRFTAWVRAPCSLPAARVPRRRARTAPSSSPSPFSRA